MRVMSLTGISVFLLVGVLAAAPGQSPAETATGAQRPADGGTVTISDNLLSNPGFEDGRTGWLWEESSRFWKDFEISNDVVRSGSASVHFVLDTRGFSKQVVEVHGVLQELKPNVFPELVSGYYRVDNWSRGSAKQYLQVVIIVWGGHRTFPHYQVRYILDGAVEPPGRPGNARYVISSESSMEPVQGEWKPFTVPVAELFREHWGEVPQGYDKVVIFFEARYDSPPGERDHVRADVYFDDLYAGPGR